AKDSVLNEASINQYVSFIGNIMASRVAAQWDFSGPAFTVTAGEDSTFRALDIAQLLLSRGEVEAVVLGAVELAGSLERAVAAQAGCPHQVVGDGAAAVVLTRARDAGT